MHNYLFQLFTFDPKKCTANVDKCMAFWKKIEDMDLKPVDCSLYKPKQQPTSNQVLQGKLEKSSEQTNKGILQQEIETFQNDVETDTKEPKINIEEIEISWCEALKELKKRKLDKVAVSYRRLN